MSKKISKKKTVKTAPSKSSAKNKSTKDKNKKLKKSPAIGKSTKSADTKKNALKKTSAKGKTKVKKVTLKKTDKKIEKKPVHIKKKLKKDETKKVQVTGPSQSEIRAKAMEKIKGYSKEDLEHFKKLILEKRDEIIEQLQNLRDQMLDPTTGEYINENSPYSLHMAEQGTDAMEREKTFLYAQRENKFLGYLEDALKRIDAGTYGICIECIEEPQHLCETCPLIPKARLEAVPHSQLCLPIKQQQEKK
jgi:RNA polymerase-binding transcription factor DksA